MYAFCFIMQDRGNVPQSDIISIPIILGIRATITLHKVSPNIPIFIQIFTLVPSTIAFSYATNLDSIRTSPTYFGIIVHWDLLARNLRKVSFPTPGHFTHICAYGFKSPTEGQASRLWPFHQYSF